MKKGDSLIKVNAHLGNDKDGNSIYTTIYVPVSEIYLVVDFNTNVVLPNIKIPENCSVIIYLHTPYTEGVNILCISEQSAEDVVLNVVNVTN